MKKTIHIKSIADILPISTIEGNTKGLISSVLFNREDIENQFSEAVFLRATIAILVLSGTGQLYTNYQPHAIQANTIILMFASHLFNIQECSSDFTCIALFVSREFMEDMDSTDMIYRRIKYGVRLFNTPVVPLAEENTGLLRERMKAVGKAIENTGHLYYKEVILNNLLAFYLDLSNIIDRQENMQQDNGRLTRYENLIKAFIELLVIHYRKEHKVEFYASELHASAHYLTLIVKRITGQSVCDFIFEMLYSDARTLLTHSKMSIQEIAALLNFSDQSSFGKFFKRKTGLSPADYRKGLLLTVPAPDNQAI